MKNKNEIIRQIGWSTLLLSIGISLLLAATLQDFKFLWICYLVISIGLILFVAAFIGTFIDEAYLEKQTLYYPSVIEEGIPSYVPNEWRDPKIKVRRKVAHKNTH